MTRNGPLHREISLYYMIGHQLLYDYLSFPWTMKVEQNAMGTLSFSTLLSYSALTKQVEIGTPQIYYY